MTEITLFNKLLSKNDRIAQEIREYLHDRNILSVNMIGSPGSGKTSLLEAMFTRIGGKYTSAVIEGDVKTNNDMLRIQAAGIPAVQIQTDGACHLNAEQVKNMLSQLPVNDIQLLIIENVGNLICPVAYDLGEDIRTVVVSVTEGEDKPLKYPSAFMSAGVLIITKIDLAPYVDTQPDALKSNALSINPNLKVIMTSAKTHAGIDELTDFLFSHNTNSDR